MIDGGGSEGVFTHFAPAARAARGDLLDTIAQASTNPVVDTLLSMAEGMVAVVNSERQIVALNDHYLAFLGVEDPAGVLGLRIGESLECVRWSDAPSGCGTGLSCRSCGAAIAQVTCQRHRHSAVAECALEVRKDGAVQSLAVLVKASPLTVDDRTMMVVFLTDVSRERRRQFFERAFFHDISNLIQGLVGTTAVMARGELEHPQLAQTVSRLSRRLSSEVAIQRVLSSGESYPVALREVDLKALVSELCSFLREHPAAAERRIRLVELEPIEIRTDPSLLERVLANMIINALEASAPGEVVELRCERTEGGATIVVSNDSNIPEEISSRIFQRYFSTKSGPGRGQGTFFMKLFTERYLAGRITFETGSGRTEFNLHLPLELAGR